MEVMSKKNKLPISSKQQLAEPQTLRQDSSAQSELHLSFQGETYQSLLYSYYLKSKEKNAKYSIRSFAKRLELSASFMSMLFSNKRHIDLNTAQNICERLDMLENDRNYFLSLVEYQTSRTDLQKKMSLEKLHRISEEKLIPYNLRLDTVIKISKWHYNAILAFLTLPNENKSTQNIAERFCLETYEAEESLERLKRLGLVQQQAGQWCSLNEYLEVKSAPSSAIRNYQKAILEKAMQAIEDQKYEERDISSVVFTIDVSKLPLARQMISHFQDQLVNALAGSAASEVYQCSIQLFRSTVKKNSF